MNDNKSDMSDELLNSYIDNELDAQDREELLTALENDGKLSQRLCELRNIKELTQHAYSLTPKKTGQDTPWLKQHFPLPAVASVLLVVSGLVAGWFAHDGLNSFVIPSTPESSQLASLDSIQGITGQKKILLHVETAEPARFTAALDSAEKLLVSYSERNQPLELEIIANAKGLDVLRSDTTAHAQRLSDLTQKYENLHILACHRAIKQLEKMGVKVQLIPEADIAPSALENIIERLQQGWVYIKV